MRHFLPAGLIALVGCAQPPSPTPPPHVYIPPSAEELASRERSRQEIERREAERRQLDELIRVADAEPSRYAAALRSAAAAAVADRPQAQRATAARTEEARLRDAVAARRAAVAADRAEAEERARENARRMQETAQRQERDRQAEVICRARGQLREDAQPYRGLLNLDNVMAGQQAIRVCWETYQRTGIMPSY